MLGFTTRTKKGGSYDKFDKFLFEGEKCATESGVSFMWSRYI